MTTRVVENSPEMTTFFAKKTTLDDLTFAKRLFSLAQTKKGAKCRQKSSFVVIFVCIY